MPDAGLLVVTSEPVTYQDAVEAFQEFLGISALAAFLILEQPDGMPGSERATAVAPHVGFRGIAFALLLMYLYIGLISMGHIFLDEALPHMSGQY